MSDDDLRRLERQFLTTGTPEHEQALLHERLRAGVLRRERLLLAAYLGKAEARSVLSAQGLVGVFAGSRQYLNGKLLPIDLDRDLVRWLLLLDAFEPEAAVRAAIAVGHWAVGEPVSPELDRERALEVSTLSAAEQFVCCPCDSHADACGAAWQRVEAEAQRMGHVPASIWLLKTASRVARTAAASWLFRNVSAMGRVAWSASTAAGWATENLGATARTTRAQAEVRARVKADLLPWVLGTGDPVVDRAGGREPRFDASRAARPLRELVGELAQVACGSICLVEEREIPSGGVRLW
jgi:hypothetical protein